MPVSCEYDNGPFGSIEGREFLDKLSDSKLLKKAVLRGVRLTWNYFVAHIFKSARLTLRRCIGFPSTGTVL